MKDKKSKSSLKLEPRFRSTNYKPSLSDRRSIQELNGLIESQRREIDHTIAGDQQFRRDQLLLQEQLSKQNRGFREAHVKSLNETQELKRVHESRVEESLRRRLIEHQDTINELTARIQELQNEVNCVSDSRDFKDAESIRSGNSHVTNQPALLPLSRDPGGMQSRSVGMPSRNDKLPDIWDTHGISGNVFVNPTSSSSSLYLGGFNPWTSNVSEHTSPHVMSERQTPDTTLDPRCQSGPSARNSFHPKEGRFSKDYGAHQQRLQITDLHFDRTRLCLYIDLFRQESVDRTDEFCVCFFVDPSASAHVSCIKGAIRVRGGVLKSTLVVDNDRQCTMYIITQSRSVPQS